MAALKSQYVIGCKTTFIHHVNDRAFGFIDFDCQRILTQVWYVCMLCVFQMNVKVVDVCTVNVVKWISSYLKMS